ncbi:MAG TPA: FliM/FliN family flagellar motor C-terminal domain-containing protein [Candidatus Elarobacter sp.]|nr:FliM/FliN family flagellar motor C-terminal domain-containing protein [Candidatus Elarobacter sp.]
MIADAGFAPPANGVRRLRFTPRAPVPLDAARAVANGVRESLRELLGEGCELDLGEPAALDAAAWARLARDAQTFLIRGQRTDVVLVVPRRDARRLVLRAFGEVEPTAVPALDPACSALELQAIDRIAARCAPALGALCAQRAEGAQRIAADAVPVCVAYFDLRVRVPIELTLGVGIVRAVPAAAPPGNLPAVALAEVALEVRAVFAEGMIDAADFVTMRPGDVVKLDTKVGALAYLQVGPRRLATGVPGAHASRNAVLCRDVAGAASSW